MPLDDEGPARALQLLTPREKDCLRLVFENHSSKEIARRLGISQTSVDTHVRNARAKLGVRDRYEAACRLQAHECATPTPAAILRAGGPRPRGRLLPSLEELTYVDRLLMVVACAIAGALVFGLLLPAFAAL